MNYKYFARLVTATAGTSTLRFVSTTESMWGVIIDEVVLTHALYKLTLATGKPTLPRNKGDHPDWRP